MSMKISMKAARVKAKLSLEEAAELIGVTRIKFMSWEKHPEKVKSKIQKKIAKVYKLSINKIFFGAI